MPDMPTQSRGHGTRQIALGGVGQAVPALRKSGRDRIRSAETSANRARTEAGQWAASCSRKYVAMRV
jgi:hypothetical protein